MVTRTILVVTDEPIVELGLRALCAGDPSLELVSVQSVHQKALATLVQLRPSVVLYGLSSGADLSAIRELLRASPETSIILWTRDMSTEIAHQAVNLGVRGFISTRSSAEKLCECIETAARGELWMEQALTMSLLNSRPVRLSKRQSQLLQLLVQGLKNKEIARTLGISEGTVKAYLTTLFEKVGARDRFELALFGLKTVGFQSSGNGAMSAKSAAITRANPSTAAPTVELQSMVAREFRGKSSSEEFGRRPHSAASQKD